MAEHLLSEPGAQALPELAAVSWRRRADGRSLRRVDRLWTLTTIAHVVPLVAAAIALGVLVPVTAPISLLLVAHAWAIPELYAARGAGVVRRSAPPGGAPGTQGGAQGEAEQVALGLLGDLVGHRAREVHARTGLILEPGALGVWLVGQAGALLVRPGGRRVHCYCVRVSEPGLPAGDRIAHLLLALRTDEAGFVTVANLAFSGACWRLRRRLRPAARPALELARAHARAQPGRLAPGKPRTG